MKLTVKQREIINRYATHMDSHEEHIRRSGEHLECAEAEANSLIETFSGQNIPEIIVMLGRVVKISRALLSTGHTQPHHAVRLVRDAIVE